MVGDHQHLPQERRYISKSHGLLSRLITLESALNGRLKYPKSVQYGKLIPVLVSTARSYPAYNGSASYLFYTNTYFNYNVLSCKLLLYACYSATVYSSYRKLGFSKFVYMIYFQGDNFIQDIYAPAKFKCCDTIAVIKELANFDQSTDKELFLSNRWGSVLHDKLFDKRTVWNALLNCYSKFNVPSLDWFLNENNQ